MGFYGVNSQNLQNHVEKLILQLVPNNHLQLLYLPAQQIVALVDQ